MKIGIDCRTILDPRAGEGAGVGHYTSLLVTYLLQADRDIRRGHPESAKGGRRISYNSYVLFFDPHASDTKSFARKNVKIVLFPEEKRHIPFWHSHFVTARTIAREKVDLFHGPANTLPYCYAGKSVVTVHDLSIYAHPEWFPNGQWFTKNVVVPRSLRAAKHIIAVSRATKQEIMNRFTIASGHITVIPEGVALHKQPMKRGARRESEHDFRERLKLGDRYILFLSTLEPRKNIERLIDAFDLVHKDRRFSDVQLVLAGARGWKDEPILKKVIHAKAGPHIRYVGYVDHNDKIDLFKYAEVFAFPSLDEGFGLPALEAMALGVPVVAGSAGALPELVGRSGILVNPQKTKEIAGALQKVLASPALQRELSGKGKRRAAAFTWEKTAKKTLAVYTSVV
ncbi:MAG: glycosyltransferase family 4 protein [Candidatus Kerfeldbacteria bacterium]|nr:glycosyltransferase family 4 protein [Candidatus Kerfeldbacteria bacterium]